MVSTAVKRETKVESSQTTQLFPLSVGTEECSLNYMKRLTAVAISNILYIRNVFTEDCYGHRKLDHLKLRILTERCRTVGAKQIVQWVKGCFDAMEKKYLKQLTLGIYTDPSDPEELIEAYTFRFTYGSNKFNCNISLNQNKSEIRISEESATTELRNSTVQLLRSIILMVQSLDRLPNECYLTMKLLYYDDITPEDYEPPGFEACDRDSFTFKGKPISISAGEVNTPYHSLRVKIRTNQEQFKDMDHNSDKNEAQELEDQCSPLEIDESSDVKGDTSEGPQHSPQNMLKNASDLKPKIKSNVNSSKSFVKQEVKAAIASAKENIAVRSVTNNQKIVESNVISKLKDMKMEDNSQKVGKRLIEVNKRKHGSDHYEVTQDSVFDSEVPYADKRHKVSKPKVGAKR